MKNFFVASKPKYSPDRAQRCLYFLTLVLWHTKHLSSASPGRDGVRSKDLIRTDVLLQVMCRHTGGTCLVENNRRLQLLYSAGNMFRPQSFSLLSRRMGTVVSWEWKVLRTTWKAKKKGDGKLSHPSPSMQYIFFLLCEQLQYRYNILNLKNRQTLPFNKF